MTNTTSNNEFAHLRFLTMKEVCALTGYSRTHIYRLEAKGEFPRRRKLSDAKIGFRFAEFEAWVQSRPCAPPSSENDDAWGEDAP